MHVKTFRAADSFAALARVKSELGADAVILDTRSVTENGRRMTEITAALDPQPAGSTPVELTDEVPVANEAAWQKEWNEIKSCLLGLMGKQLDMSVLTPRQRQAMEFLKREGVDEQVSVRLYTEMTTRQRTPLLEILSDLVPCKALSFKTWRQRIHAFAGPFGAGKTSTTIRMALACKNEHPNARILLVNGDNGRARGRLILKHYAELSGFGYAEASSRQALANALRSGGSYDYVFVDLPGMTGNSVLDSRLAELGLLNVDDFACHLVLSPLYDAAQFSRFLKNFASKGTKSVIWTKLDEACSFGAIVNMAEASGLPVSALSWGPGFKDTMAPAENVLLWKMIFKHEMPGASYGASARTS